MGVENIAIYKTIVSGVSVLFKIFTIRAEQAIKIAPPIASRSGMAKVAEPCLKIIKILINPMPKASHRCFPTTSFRDKTASKVMNSGVVYPKAVASARGR